MDNLYRESIVNFENDCATEFSSRNCGIMRFEEIM